MTNFFTVFADVIRMLTFQSEQRGVRGRPGRKDQTIGTDERPRPGRDGNGGC